VALSEVGTNPSIFWYQGQAWWKLTVNGRLYYVSPTRIYSTQDGRFVERGPTDGAGLNRYAPFGSGDDPVGESDATGVDEDYRIGLRQRLKVSEAVVERLRVQLREGNVPYGSHEYEVLKLAILRSADTAHMLKLCLKIDLQRIGSQHSVQRTASPQSPVLSDRTVEALIEMARESSQVRQLQAAQPVPAAPGQPEPAAPTQPELAPTEANVTTLATIITSEMSVGNEQEKTAVAWTWVNRVRRGIRTRGQYATGQQPTQGARDLATRILSGQVADNTGGATHFYSPQSMPEEGEDTAGHDVGGGLETIGDHSCTYRPGFSTRLLRVDVPGTRDWFIKVYRE
jgi:hypothetical protein